MPGQWRLVDSGLVLPAESAALDEAILEAHIAGLVPNTLHFYRRSQSTVSVGYFQRVSESVDLEQCARRGVAIVRRKSGGSSIYTDEGQLIYGLVVSEDDVPQDRAETFRIVCGAIAEAVSQLGLEARYRPMNDIEVSGRKVSGNAQLRRKGSVLQHGTIIVDADLEAMDAVLRPTTTTSDRALKPSDRVSSLSSMLGKKVDIEELKAKLVRHFAVCFESSLKPGRLTQWELDMVARMVDEKYSRDEWNLKF